MLKIWFSCCFIMGAIIATAQPIRLLVEGTVEPTQFLEVLEVEYEHGLVFVPVIIKGKKYRLLLDTGASNSIASRVVEEVGGTYLADSIIYGDINNATAKTSFVHFKKVDLGKLQLKDFNFIVMDSPLYELFNFDGIIGSNTFRELVLQFDQEQGVVRIATDYKSLNLKKKEGAKITLSKYQLIPNFLLKLDSCGKRRQWVDFDSGYNGWLSMELRTWSDLQSKNPTWKEISTAKNNSTLGMYGSSKDTIGQLMAEAPVLKVGNHCFPNNIITFSFSKGARMGTTLLKMAKVTLDYKNKRLFVVPYEKSSVQETIKAYRARELAGIGFLWEEELVVSSVWKNLSAAAANIPVGLVIKKVNEVELTGKSSAFVGQYLRTLDWTEKVVIEGQLPNQPLQLYTLVPRL